jgi:hypothetical protein
MPPRKETKSQLKCIDMLKDFISDAKTGEVPDNVIIGRVIKNLGNKTIDVMVDRNGIKTIQVKIPGKFSGRGRKGVMINVGSFLLIAEDESIRRFEMLALIEDNYIKAINKLTPINPIILNCIKEDMAHDDIEFDRGDLPKEDLEIDDSKIDDI